MERNNLKMFEGGFEENRSMDQFFGPESKYRPRPNQENRIIEKPKVTFSIGDFFEKIAQPFLGGKRIFWLFILVLVMGIIGSLYHFPMSLFIKSFIGVAVLGVMSFFLIRVTKEVPYTPELEHYVGNASVTLKALFMQFSFTRHLIPHAESLFLWGIIAVITERLFLSWFFLSSLSSILYGLGFFAMVVGTILCFANRETDIIAEGLTVYCVGMALVMIWNALLYGSFPLLFGVNYLFFAVVAYYARQWKVVPVTN